MKISITGGGGFVGRHLSALLLQRGHRVTAIGRRPPPDPGGGGAFTAIRADTSAAGAWQEAIAASDGVVNLAGETIFQRWNRRTKARIRDSRILTTRHVVEALPAGPGTLLLNASAVGYYGDRNDAVLTEAEPPGDDFLARLAADWEAEASAAAKKEVRVVAARLGIVLGAGGGALAKMIPAFKAFAGGPVGSGSQWFPWIHTGDLCAAFLHVIETPRLEGPFNFCAPHPVRNREFAAALGAALDRPAVVPVPAVVLRLALGEFASALLASLRVVPERLTREGFTFAHPRVETALASLVEP